MRATRFFLTAPALAAAVIAASTQGILLRRELKENAVDTYAFEMRSSQTISSPAMGMDMPIDIGATMKIAMKMGKVDAEKKQADLEVHGTDINLDLGMMAGMAGDMPKEFKANGKIDELGKITGVQFPGPGGGMMGGGMMAMFMGGAGATMTFPTIEFPDKPVNIGDTWDVPVPKNPMFGNVEQKLVATLSSQREEGDMKVYVIKLSGSFPVNLDLGAMTRDNPDAASMMADMKMTGTMDVATDVLVERTTGKVISLNSVMNQKTKLEAGMGSADIVGATTIKMVLQQPQ